MQWAVEELRKLGNETFSFNEYVHVDDLINKNDEIRHISPVRVTGNVSFSGTLISFHLHISGQMVLPCSLTLEDVQYPFSIDTIESFQLKRDAHVDEAENEIIHPIEGQKIDLMPIIKENILLSIPMKIVHPDAQMMLSGEGWEIVTDQKKKDSIDPRMAKLAELFKNEKQN